MKIVAYLDGPDNFSHCQGVDEIILSPLLLSRMGSQSLEECLEMAHQCRKKGIAPLLQWDILLAQEKFDQLEGALKQFPWDAFSAIRVQDKGALNFLLETRPSTKIQLILETGYHNLRSIEQAIENSGPNIGRVILSSELTGEKIIGYNKALATPLEVLGYGPLLLYYSPRKLLTNLNLPPQKLVLADSLEGNQRNLPLLQNEQGTFLFYSRHRSILSRSGQLAGEGIGALTLDLRLSPNFSLLPKLVEKIRQGANGAEFKKLLPHHFQGFFKANKTSAVFKKLKNEKLPLPDKNYLGEVVETVKGHYSAILIKSPHLKLKKGDSIHIYTPEGRTRQQKANTLQNSTLEEVEEVSRGEVVLIPWISGTSVKSAVYLKT